MVSSLAGGSVAGVSIAAVSVAGVSVAGVSALPDGLIGGIAVVSSREGSGWTSVLALLLMMASSMAEAGIHQRACSSCCPSSCPLVSRLRTVNSVSPSARATSPGVNVSASRAMEGRIPLPDPSLPARGALRASRSTGIGNSQQFPKEIPKEALTSGPSGAMINIAYVPRATAKDRGSWSLSRVVDTAGIGRGVPRLMSPQHPQSNAPMWIRPRSEKSFAVLAALFLSLFVFVFAAGEAGAEEQVVLPMDPWCAMPPDTAPTDTVPPGAALCPPTVLPPSAVDDSVSLPARGTAPGTEL